MRDRRTGLTQNPEGERQEHGRRHRKRGGAYTAMAELASGHLMSDEESVSVEISAARAVAGFSSGCDGEEPVSRSIAASVEKGPARAWCPGSTQDLRGTESMG
jgi:hypothetical protein